MTRTAPCEWPLAGVDDCPALDALPDEGDEPLRALVEEAATAYLWQWTGQAFGLCDVTVRPHRQDCQPGTYAGATGPAAWPGWRFGPVLVAGGWRNIACGQCGDACSCDRVTSIRLPGPVASVESVTVDGDAVDPTAYRVDDRAYLVRHDGGSWPICNDADAPSGAEGTWEVAYTFGVPVPAGGKIAAGVLACELAKAALGRSDCQLPQRVQTLTREGVTIGLLDPFEGLEGGRTGIWVIDSWVTSITHAPRRSTVHSPDARRPARTTYTGGPA